MLQDINISVRIDDENIQRKIEQAAPDAIIKSIERKVAARLFQVDWPLNAAKLREDIFGGPLTEYAGGIVRDFLESHKDEIIRAAAKEIADRLSQNADVKHDGQGET